MKLTRFEVLTDSEVEQIHRAALQILDRTGIQVDDERILQLLADAGAKIDSQRRRCKIPEGMIADALQTTPHRIPLFNRLGEQVATLGEGKTHPYAGHGTPFFLDLEKGPHPATKAEVCNLVRLVDALPNLDLACVPATPQDVPTVSLFAHAAEAVLNNSLKPLYVAPDRAPVAEAIMDLAHLATGVENLSAHPVMVFQVSLESPLRWPKGICDLFLTIASAGVPMVIHTAPLSGASAPLTLAGVMAMHNAEVLAGVVISQLIRPGTPVIYGGGWGTCEMRQGNRIVASPEAALLRIAGGQLTRFYDLPRHSIGIHTDCPSPDEQVGWEKMLTALATMQSGFDLMSMSGCLATGMMVSYEQVVLDNEMLGIVRRVLRGFDVTPDALALEMIERIGPGGSFLTEPHTLARLRGGEFWEPMVAFRGSLQGWVETGSPNVLDRARARAREILDAHWPAPLPDDVQEEMTRVIARLEQEIT
jgi:trimethylamine--corrinoid protein Co-methyltransferase